MNKTKKGQEGVVFLKLFTKEILNNLSEKEGSKQRINSEKLKLKLFDRPQIVNVEDAFKKIITEDQIPKEEVPKTITPEEKLPKEEVPKSIIQSPEKRINMIHRENMPTFQPTYPISEKRREEKIDKKPIIKKNENLGMERSIANFQEKSVEVKKTANRIDLKKLLTIPTKHNNIPPIELINPMLRDNTVVAIECPGPGKNIMIKKYNQINMTKIVLSEEEIKSIIDHFSREAKIPLAGGILKAAVGNSIISAVVSEFVGSRFVINKITPYSLIGSK